MNAFGREGFKAIIVIVYLYAYVATVYASKIMFFDLAVFEFWFGAVEENHFHGMCCIGLAKN
jgi:hypothetical protein